MAEIQRVKFGIQGLDKALNGGIPQNNIVLLSGGAGTGKSTFCLQFLINGAELFGEKGLYISTEQTVKELTKTTDSHGWKLDPLIKSGLIKICYFNTTKGDSFLESIKREVADFQPKRVIIDSITTLSDGIMMSDLKDDISFSMVRVSESVSPVPRTEKMMSKIILYHLFEILKGFSTTALLTSELPEETKFLSGDEVSEFIADGVFLLSYLGVGQSVFRSLRIRKMRYTNHEMGSINYDLTDEGIAISTETQL